MDGHLTSASGAHHEAAGANMADSPSSSFTSDGGEPTLTDISADIRSLAAAMVAKEDLRCLSDTLHAAIRTDVSALKADITAHYTMLQQLESTT
ncbi:Hypothetical predicted protein [Pelobates cultripes]|uniref:Uncharacterized protein n=1 Tax=Pelobates cultripes TaxID=61616 RepID=A0AAD1W2J1_PELCU|nr:Hypothetical predicted protein [Pelobates cultripes]